MVFEWRIDCLCSGIVERDSIRANIASAGHSVEVILALVIVVLIVGALVLPWIQRGQIEGLKSDVLKLRTQFSQLREQVSNLATSAAVRPEGQD